LSRGVEIPELLARFAKREPRRRPLRRALERLLAQLRRGAEVALGRGGLGIGEAALGDQVGRGEGVRRAGANLWQRLNPFSCLGAKNCPSLRIIAIGRDAYVI